MTELRRKAPGGPGAPARWASSAKDGVGTSFGRSSRVWFTIRSGIVTEIFYPRPDFPCTREMGFHVAKGMDSLSNEETQAAHSLEYSSPGVPVFRLTNTCLRGRYRIEKEILSEPDLNTVLQKISFAPLEGDPEGYRLFLRLNPHLTNQGGENTGFLADHNGVPMLFARGQADTLALACSAGWRERTVGFVGSESDPLRDLAENKRITRVYEEARDGNVLLLGEVDLRRGGKDFIVSVGFGADTNEAAYHALSGLQDSFEEAREKSVRAWRGWHESLASLGPRGGRSVYPTGAAVLRVHEAKQFPGGIVASLSTPWGEDRGDEDKTGYHVVWTRDLTEGAGALLAMGAKEESLRVLRYLQVTQDSDGHWPQSMWLGGAAAMDGIEMDETALPILLVDLARREGLLKGVGLDRFWPMVRRAASYVLKNGPVTQEDRWERDPGYSPFTLGAEIAGLLAAADLAQIAGEEGAASYLRETADIWNAHVERWIYSTGTELDRRFGVEGHYVRIHGPGEEYGFFHRLRRAAAQTLRGRQATFVESPDALALVRFGLRAPDDPRIGNTVKIIDSTLKVDTPRGPAWHRFRDDHYGEEEDGSPFRGKKGIGRIWPLLTGERAHFELAAGRKAEAERLLHAMESFAGDGGLIPEQVWDSRDIPEKGLFIGRPTGSAMPLVWAHAEHIKLLRSIRDGRVFDMPPQTRTRYILENAGTELTIWRFNHKVDMIPRGKKLRIEALAPAVVRWTRDAWNFSEEIPTRDTNLGVHFADLPTTNLKSGEEVAFTFFWPDADRWEEKRFEVKIQ
ncbi:MAG TPA: glycoside hydrolase family 15 protein [Thermodesulfobacteriota bacterium]|nr:glycoside hydrolase family 15 protein [Thermodesulfobacteriota bacterium]